MGPQASTVLHGREGSQLRLDCQDCIAGMAQLEPASVDVVVTSPPYNLGIAYGAYDDSAPRGEYLRWTGSWAAAVARVLAPDGSLFLNMGSKPRDPWIALDVAACFRKMMTLQNTFHWVKSIAIDGAALGQASAAAAGDLAAGHYKPINSPRFVNDCHEFIFHFTHRGDVPLDRLAIGVPYQDKSNVARWKGAANDRRCRGNTWFLPYETIQSRDRDRPHPATFPVELPRRCILLHGRERARLVMDPFMGIGSTALACVDLGVEFLGFEIDPVYCAEAERRLLAAGARRGAGSPAAQVSTDAR
jgi:site-specific DNA-methyltransferase (adenine-specific)